MTLGAATRAVEILLTKLRIAGLQVGNIDRASIALQRIRLHLRVMDEGDDRFDVRIRQVLRRHAFIDTAVPNHRTDLVAANIFSDERRPRQVGPGLPAHRITPMAEAAGRGEEHLPSLHELWCVSLRRHGLRRSLRRWTLLRAASSALALTTASASRRRCGLRRLSAKDGDDQHAEEQCRGGSRSTTDLRR